MPTYFINAPGRLPGGHDPPFRITHFEFNQASQGLMFDAATDIELHLMTKLLQSGYRKVTGLDLEELQRLEEQQKRESDQKIAEQQKIEANQKIAETVMAASMERLRKQNEELRKDSPPQSPKGTFAPRDIDTIDTNNTPINLGRLSLNPPAEPSRRFSTENELPRRRLSEPQHYTGTLGAGLDISPLRALSGSKAIPIRDPKTRIQGTPTKASKRTSFVVGDTIHEENENEDA